MGRILKNLPFLMTTVIVLTCLVCMSQSEVEECQLEGSLYPPDENGLCAESMVHTPDGQCLQCPEGCYKSKCDTLESSCTRCLRCRKCENLHRLYKTPCKTDHDASCGRCMDGYCFDNKNDNGERSCHICKLEDHSPADDSDKSMFIKPCDKDKGHFFLHWHGNCPVGTRWNGDIECCEKCQGCGNIMFLWTYQEAVCDKDQHQFQRHWNGECPYGTFWNPITMCCHSIQFYQYQHNEKDFITQSDKPKAECKRSDNNYLPFEDKYCLQGTEFVEQSGCCHGCPDCKPGWKRLPDCIGGCDPCPERFFSANPINNLECFPCTECDILNREQLSQCRPDRDTKCGKCFQNYKENNSSICIRDDESVEFQDEKSAENNSPQNTVCDQVKGERKPELDGSCFQGSLLCGENNCCIPTQQCGPGNRHKNTCEPLCEPCPPGYFSSDEDNHDCAECRKCELKNRYLISECSKRRNTMCGECLPGYVEDISYYGKELVQKCIKCTLVDGKCERRQTKNNDMGDEEGDFEEHHENPINMVLIGVIGLLFGVIAGIAIALIISKYTKCIGTKDQGQGTKDQGQMTEDKGSGTEDKNMMTMD